MADNLAQAQQLFQTYATNFDPGQAGYDFWAGKIGELGLEKATQQFLTPQDPNAPRYAAMQADPDWQARQAQNLFSTYTTDFTPTQEAKDFWAGQLGTLGLEQATEQFLNPAQGASAPRYEAMQADPEYRAAMGLASLPAVQQAQNLFGTYATDFTPTQEGVDFWSKKIDELGLNKATELFVTPEDLNAPRTTAMYQDPEYLTRQAEDLFGTYATAFKPTGENLDFWKNRIREVGRQKALEEFLNPEDLTAPRTKQMFADPDYAKAQARALFQTYTTDLVPNQEALDFWADKIAKQGYEKTLYQFLSPAQGAKAPRAEAMFADPDYDKYYQASSLSSILNSVYGLDKKEASQIGRDLFKGKETDETFKSYYDQLLEGGLTPELRTKILQDAAQKAPDSPFFKNNPDALKIYTPIGEAVSKPGEVGQYGYLNNAPILNADQAERLLGGDVFTGGPPDQRTGTWDKDDSKLGWDLNSKYASSIATGAGVFGVKATKEAINEFSRIENEIAEGGGIKTVNYGEGLEQVANVKFTDPETGKVGFIQRSLSSIFPGVDDSGMPTGKGYQDYLNTKAALEKGAAQLGIDASKYTSIKDLYNAVNEKSKDLYVVTGRANRWDPEVAQEQGITGVGQSRGGVNHATVLYKKTGDKLVPVQTLKTFNFDDPNTSRGFLGDLAGSVMEILSIPPISMALGMAGGLPALLSGNLVTGMTYGGFSPQLADAMSKSIFNPMTVGSAVGSAFKITDPAIQKLIGTSLLNAGLSGLTTAAATGDLSKAGISALAGGVGAGVSGGVTELLKDVKIPPATKRIASELLGGAAAKSVTGQDVGKYAVDRLLNAGISALLGAGAEKAGVPTKGPGRNLFNAMVPIITRKTVSPEDVVQLAAALSAYESQG